MKNLSKVGDFNYLHENDWSRPKVQYNTLQGSVWIDIACNAIKSNVRKAFDCSENKNLGSWKQYKEHIFDRINGYLI